MSTTNNASLAALRNNSAALAEKLRKQIDASSNPGFVQDERIWKPQRDKSGLGSAIIRFLPPVDGEDSCYVRMYSYGFKGPTGMWYIENSLSTIGQEDPVGKYNSELWNTGDEKLRDIARRYKRRTQFYSNILVIEDRADPTNNGKVKIYPYGKKILEMIKDKMNPRFPGEKSVNIFDFFEGADFHLKITTNEGDFPNYDKSVFAEPKALFDGDDNKILEVWKQQHSLEKLLDPSNFKSYAELDAKLKKVLNLSGGYTAPRVAENDSDNEDNDEAEVSEVVFRKPEVKSAPLPKEDDEDFESDPMAFFDKFGAKK